MAYVLKYNGEIAEKVAFYFMDNVFVSGQGPDFKEWMAEQGATIILDKADTLAPWKVSFPDQKTYTFFALKFL